MCANEIIVRNGIQTTGTPLDIDEFTFRVFLTDPFLITKYLSNYVKTSCVKPHPDFMYQEGGPFGTYDIISAKLKNVKVPEYLKDIFG